MAIVHMTESEVVKEIASVLEKVREGDEIIVEKDNRPIAVIKPRPTGRKISEVIAELETRGSSAAMDDDFAKDVEEAIRSHRQPWNPPYWD